MFQIPFNGEGLVFGDYVMTLLGLLAVLMNLAVIRAPDIVETDLHSALRRIKTAGIALVCSRHCYVLYDKGDIMCSPPVLFGMILLYVAMITSAVYMLMYPKIMENDIGELRRARSIHQAELERCDRILARHGHDRRQAERRTHIPT